MTGAELLKSAEEAMQRAYAPYSGFKVGAALLAKSGRLYCGCNIENSAYSPTNCAERTAFFTAVFNSEREFEAIAVVGGTDGNITDFCPPCGVCRQVMSEFCGGDFKIYLSDGKNIKQYLLKELLPEAFSTSI